MIATTMEIAKVMTIRTMTTMRNTKGTTRGTTKGPALVVTGGVVSVEGVVTGGGVTASATVCIHKRGIKARDMYRTGFNRPRRCFVYVVIVAK